MPPPCFKLLFNIKEGQRLLKAELYYQILLGLCTVSNSAGWVEPCSVVKTLAADQQTINKCSMYSPCIEI